MNSLQKLPEFIAAARKSPESLQSLNEVLYTLIPFNRSHRFHIEELGIDFVRTRGPYLKENLNHIQGIHACGIATIAELSAGLLLLSRLDPQEYRLIMAGMEVEYQYQAKKDIVAETRMTAEQLEREIIAVLQTSDALLKTMTTAVQDVDGNSVATVRTTWQIKPWSQVRTAVEG
jgi:acyl-coenzyme A thioesterase PaaI-like protein